jgi:hypothetical protein
MSFEQLGALGTQRFSAAASRPVAMPRPRQPGLMKKHGSDPTRSAAMRRLVPRSFLYIGRNPARTSGFSY